MRRVVRSIGLHRYGPLLRTRGVRGLLVSSFVARLGQFGTGVALLLAVHAASGSFGIAGAASGLMAAGSAVSRVGQGRLIDRRGGARVMLATAALLAVAATAQLAVLAAGGATVPTLALSAVVGGTLPAVDTAGRMAWAALSPDPHERTRAYSLEGMTAELAAIVGPSCAGVVATAISPQLALAGTVTFLAVGAVAIARCHAMSLVETRSGARAQGGGLLRRLALPGLMMLGLGLTVGALEVGIPAFADDRGVPGATGPLFAMLSSGSVLGGLWYGARAWHAPLTKRLLVGFACVTVGATLLQLAGGPLGLGALLVLLGIPIPIVLTMIFMLTDGRVPRGRRGEAISSVTSALLVGIALGSALSGWMTAHESAHASFVLAAALSLVPLAAAARGARHAAVPAAAS